MKAIRFEGVLPSFLKILQKHLNDFLRSLASYFAKQNIADICSKKNLDFKKLLPSNNPLIKRVLTFIISIKAAKNLN